MPTPVTTHFGYDDLIWDGDVCILRLYQYESAWSPDDRRIYGPCTITYLRYPDGGIDATINMHELIQKLKYSN
jgi:hypothetical protein